MIDKSDAELGITATKFRNIFRPELVAACESGTIDIVVWTFVRELADLWLLDTEEIEGANGIIKAIHKAAPAIGWDALQ